MEALLLALGGVGLGVAGILFWIYGARQSPADEAAPATKASPRWEVSTEACGGRTTVLVRNGRQSVTIAQVRDGSPTWEDEILAAQTLAEQRAAVLNSGPRPEGDAR